MWWSVPVMIMARVGLSLLLDVRQDGVYAGSIRTSSSSMEVREPHALLGYFVNVGRANLAAEAANVGEAQIIGDDDEKVGAFTHICDVAGCGAGGGRSP